jgi:hypothetical protein
MSCLYQYVIKQSIKFRETEFPQKNSMRKKSTFDRIKKKSDMCLKTIEIRLLIIVKRLIGI